MSTSPTLMSWRRRSSERIDSSGNENLRGVRPKEIRERKHQPKTGVRYAMIPRRLNSAQAEPEKLVRAQCQQVGHLAYAGEDVPAKHFHENISFESAQVQFDGLC